MNSKNFVQNRSGNRSSAENVKALSAQPLIIQRKLSVGKEDDEFEKEADSTADRVMRLPETNFIQRKCADCGGEDKVQRKIVNENAAPIIQSKPAGHMVIGESTFRAIQLSRGRGSSLSGHMQSFMSSRMGTDFSGVKIHTNTEAVQLSKGLNAKAFTRGNDIYFNEGQYRPESAEGKRLLAHELTHTIQQGNGADTVQRAGFGDVRIAEGYNQAISDIKTTAAYKALVPDEVKITEDIISSIEKFPDWPTRLSYIMKLKTVFATKEKEPAVISAETQSSTTAAVVEEKARVAKPAAAKNLTIEEKASSDLKRTWVKITGKFGGGTYQVDRTNPANMVVKAKVFLNTAGTGTAADIANIKQMEDGIEKAASMKGFLVDITFVDAPDAETFTADVNPSEWEDATNWSGGEPRGFAHELLHMFAFELDRYNYIDSHASNTSMVIGKRLHWFKTQLSKPADFDNDASLMGYGQHPLDDDACRVAGLDMATCVAARQKATKP